MASIPKQSLSPKPANLAGLRLASMLDGGVSILRQMLNGPTGGDLEPDDWQVDALLNHGNEDQLWCVHRQGGKSQTQAARILRDAACFADTHVGVLAASEPAALRLIETIRSGLHAAPWIAEIGRAQGKIVLSNGSTVTAFAAGENATSIRGQVFGCRDWRKYGARIIGLAIDEGAYVPQAAYAASGACCLVNNALTWQASSPGPPGPFRTAVLGSDPGYHRVVRDASMCPRLTPELLERERRKIGDRLFRIEYCLDWDLGARSSPVFDDPRSLLALDVADQADDDEQFESLSSRLRRLKGAR